MDVMVCNCKYEIPVFPRSEDLNRTFTCPECGIKWFIRRSGRRMWRPRETEFPLAPEQSS